MVHAKRFVEEDHPINPYNTPISSIVTSFELLWKKNLYSAVNNGLSLSVLSPVFCGCILMERHHHQSWNGED